MQRDWLNFVLGIVMALGLAAISPQSASAQRGRLRVAAQQRRAEAAQRRAEKANPAAKSTPNMRGMEGLPPKWVESLQNMSPDDQERFMQNDARFKKLAPPRQQQIRNRLQQWNRLTPEEQQAYLQRERVLERMTPEQQQYVRNTLLPKWQTMPVDRRQAINRHLAILQQMSPETQQAALNDPKFMQGLSPDEQDMLRGLNSLRNPAPPAQ